MFVAEKSIAWKVIFDPLAAIKGLKTSWYGQWKGLNALEYSRLVEGLLEIPKIPWLDFLESRDRDFEKIPGSRDIPRSRRSLVTTTISWWKSQLYDSSVSSRFSLVSELEHAPLEAVYIFFDTATYDEIARDVKVSFPKPDYKMTINIQHFLYLLVTPQ